MTPRIHFDQLNQQLAQSVESQLEISNSARGDSPVFMLGDALGKLLCKQIAVILFTIRYLFINFPLLIVKFAQRYRIFLPSLILETVINRTPYI